MWIGRSHRSGRSSSARDEPVREAGFGLLCPRSGRGPPARLPGDRRRTLVSKFQEAARDGGRKPCPDCRTCSIARSAAWCPRSWPRPASRRNPGGNTNTGTAPTRPASPTAGIATATPTATATRSAATGCTSGSEPAARVAYLVLTCRVLLALVMLAAALGKLRSRDALTGFQASVRGLGLLPDRSAAPVAGVVIAGELAAAALLAVPATTGAGFAVAAV